MKVEPSLNEVLNGPRGMRRGIEVCLNEQCLVSAVGLIFSAVDALAALARPLTAADATRSDFKAWVEAYMLPGSKLACTADELYGARCGVLHAYSAESSAQRDRGARRLIYEWRSGPAADRSIPLPPDSLVIQIEDLHEAFSEAVRCFLVAADTDPTVRAKVHRHLPSLLCYRPWPTMEGLATI